MLAKKEIYDLNKYFLCIWTLSFFCKDKIKENYHRKQVKYLLNLFNFTIKYYAHQKRSEAYLKGISRKIEQV